MNILVAPKGSLLLVLIATLCANEALARKWTDSTGGFSVEAEFVELISGQVALRRSDGLVIRVPLERLSGADQQHVQSLTAPAASRNLPTAATSQPEVNQAGTPPSGDNGTQTVIAEGVGTNADDALKDAFRAAVSQVVGMVVDAETLVKSDELIEDKILTYSNGFVKAYERISEKSEGGLFRVKIRATVERRNLIAKLTSARIITRQVDGTGMFSSVVTELEAEENAAKLVEEALEGFPLNCLEARVVGDPKIVEKNNTDVTIAVTVSYSADFKSFDTFATKLHGLLNHVAKKQGTFSIKASSERGSSALFVDSDRVGRGRLSIWSRHIPGLDELAQRRDAVILAANSQRNKNMDRTEWNYYLLDSSTRAAFASRAACVFTTKLSFLDKSGGLITTDSFPACIPRTEPNDKSLKGNSSYHVSLVFSGTEGGGTNGAYDGFYYGYSSKSRFGFYPEYFSLLAGGQGRTGTYRNRGEVLFVIAPLFLDSCPYMSCSVDYVPSLSITRTVTLNVDELREIHTARTELRFEGTLPESHQGTE